MPEGYMFKFEVAKSPRQIFGAFDRLLGPERAAAFWRQYRDTYITAGRYQVHQVGRLQHGAHPAALPPVHDGRRRDHGRRLGPARPRAGLGARRRACYAIVDLHAAPGGQTGINHDDGPGYPLMFYVPRDRELTVKLWRAIARALCRQSGDPGLRHPERADRALSRRGDAQSAAGAVLQAT